MALTTAPCGGVVRTLIWMGHVLAIWQYNFFRSVEYCKREHTRKIKKDYIKQFRSIQNARNIYWGKFVSKLFTGFKIFLPQFLKKIYLCNTCCLDAALLVFPPKGKLVGDKTVIMTYLNKHTHAHTHTRCWCIGKPQRCLRESLWDFRGAP